MPLLPFIVIVFIRVNYRLFLFDRQSNAVCIPSQNLGFFLNEKFYKSSQCYFAS